MTQELTNITITKAFADFLGGKGDTLTRRAQRNYTEVLDLLGEFLEEHGITEMGTTPRRGAGTIDQVLALVDEFDDDYLVSTIKAEREFLRQAGVVSRDLCRWLKNLGAKQKKGSEASTASAHA